MIRNQWIPWDEAVAISEQPDAAADAYPREWGELADEARELAGPFRKPPRFDIRNRPRDDDLDRARSQPGAPGRLPATSGYREPSSRLYEALGAV